MSGAHRLRDDALGRIAALVAIMLYEIELLPDGSFRCHEFAGLESFVGAIPAGVSADDAYAAAVHPDDRGAYDAAWRRVARGEDVELEYRLFHADGSERWVLDRMRPVPATDGRVLIGGVVVEWAARGRAETAPTPAPQAEHVALNDGLTGLPNRAAFQEHLDVALARAARSGHGAAVLHVDLDDFTGVNDRYGRAAGDELLRGVASCLRSTLRGSDVVARHDGDQFLVLVADVDEQDRSVDDRLREASNAVAGKLRRALSAPFTIDGAEIFVSASIGISLFPDDATDAAMLLQHADVARSSVKARGRDGHALFKPGLTSARER